MIAKINKILCETTRERGENYKITYVNVHENLFQENCQNIEKTSC